MTTKQPANGCDVELSQDEFERRFGGAYEHSPWIAGRTWREGTRCSAREAVAAAMRQVVEASDRASQLSLLRAHPDLAGRLALSGEVTAVSASEQGGAGLDCCSPTELEEFLDLNERYRNRFGFPFILAVRGLGRSDILAAFRQRIGNDHSIEFREALEQVHRIARFRIADAAGESG